MAEISDRLQALAKAAGEATEYWDICCDHGLLGLWLLKTHPMAQVHFVDQIPSVIEALSLKLSEGPGRALKPRATLHLIDGRQLQQPLAGAIVIAGVGGELIFSLLQTWVIKSSLKANRVVLGPHKDEEWLAERLPELFPSGIWSFRMTTVLERGRSRLIYVLQKRENF